MKTSPVAIERNFVLFTPEGEVPQYSDRSHLIPEVGDSVQMEGSPSVYVAGVTLQPNRLDAGDSIKITLQEYMTLEQMKEIIDPDMQELDETDFIKSGDPYAAAPGAPSLDEAAQEQRVSHAFAEAGIVVPAGPQKDAEEVAGLLNGGGVVVPITAAAGASKAPGNNRQSRSRKSGKTAGGESALPQAA